MKATKHEMRMSMLGSKHLKQVKDEEQKNTYSRRKKQHGKTEGTRHGMYRSTKTHEAREHVKHKARETRRLRCM